MIIALVAGVVIAVITAVLAMRAAATEASREARRVIDHARGEAAAAVKAAELEGAAVRKAAEAAAREASLAARSAADDTHATTEAVVLLHHSPAIGKRLAETGLLENARVQLVALIRGGKAQTTFDPAFVLRPGDTLVVTGTHGNIDAVMEAQRDLVEIVHTLKQVVCVKG